MLHPQNDFNGGITVLLTAAQSAVRAVFGTISQLWRTLTDAERSAWKGATDDYPYQNRLGDTRTLSGSALHQKLNLNLASVEADFLSSPLLPIAIDQPTSAGVAFDTALSKAVVRAEFVGTPTVNTSIAIFATESSSAGRTNLKNRLRKIDVVTADALDSYDCWTNYVAVFGVPSAGANVAIEFRPVQTQTGQGGAKLYTVSQVG